MKCTTSPPMFKCAPGITWQASAGKPWKAARKVGPSRRFCWLVLTRNGTPVAGYIAFQSISFTFQVNFFECFSRDSFWARTNPVWFAENSTTTLKGDTWRCGDIEGSENPLVGRFAHAPVLCKSWCISTRCYSFPPVPWIPLFLWHQQRFFLWHKLFFLLFACHGSNYVTVHCMTNNVADHTHPWRNHTRRTVMRTVSVRQCPKESLTSAIRISSWAVGPPTLMGFHCDWLCNRKAQLIKSIQSPQLWRQPWPPRTYLQEASLSTIHFLNETLQHFRRTNFVFCDLSLAKCHRHGVCCTWNSRKLHPRLQTLGPKTFQFSSCNSWGVLAVVTL